MPRKVTLTQSFAYTDLPHDIQIVDTNDMGGCITVVLRSVNGLRAQHCAGGILALQEGFWALANGDADARAVIVGVPTGLDQGRIDEMIGDCGVAHVAHVNCSRALVHIGLMSTASTANEVRMSVVPR